MDIEKLLRSKLTRGLEAAVSYSSASLGQKLRQNAVDAEGRRSMPGEYPYMDTGRLVEHVDHEVDADQLRAASGIREAASGKQPADYFLHLERNMGRLGQVESFVEDAPQIRAAFELGALQ